MSSLLQGIADVAAAASFTLMTVAVPVECRNVAVAFAGASGARAVVCGLRLHSNCCGEKLAALSSIAFIGIACPPVLCRDVVKQPWIGPYLLGLGILMLILLLLNTSHAICYPDCETSDRLSVLNLKEQQTSVACVLYDELIVIPRAELRSRIEGIAKHVRVDMASVPDEGFDYVSVGMLGDIRVFLAAAGITLQLVNTTNMHVAQLHMMGQFRHYVDKTAGPISEIKLRDIRSSSDNPIDDTTADILAIHRNIDNSKVRLTEPCRRGPRTEVEALVAC